MSSNYTQEIEPATAPALDPEQVTPSKDGGLNPAMKAADLAALEAHTDPTLSEVCVARTSDTLLAIGSRAYAPVHHGLDRAFIVEFSSTVIFRDSPFGDVLNSLKALSLAGDS